MIRHASTATFKGDDRLLQHFTVARPLQTHWRKAACAEVRCPHYTWGWETVVPTASLQADYIRYQCGRHFREEKAEGGLAKFLFPPGQTCFREHFLPERDPFLVHRVGQDRRLMDADQWTYTMNEELYKTEKRRNHG